MTFDSAPDEPSSEPVNEAAPLPSDPRDMLDIPHGVHFDVPAEVYHRRILGTANATAIKHILRSAAHYHAWAKGRDVDTPAFAFGRAFHAAVLEPEHFDAAFVVEPIFGDCRFKANKALRDAWRAENAGKIVIDHDDMTAIRGMQRALREHPIASSLLAGARSEVTVRWRDEATGIECKGRLDALTALDGLEYALDLKTTEDAAQAAFERSVASYGYHRQDAFYSAGMAEVGRPIEGFVFIAVEKEPPYAVGVFVLDRDARRKGAEANARALSRLADCIERGDWPAYPTAIQTLSLPPWAA